MHFELLESKELLAVDLALLQSFETYPDGAGSGPRDIVNVGGVAYFSASTATHGMELWRSDGTAAGTYLLKDINPGTGDSLPWDLTEVNGTLYFTADDGTGAELWKSDGASAGTVKVKDISSESFGIIGRLTNVNGTLFFAAYHPDTDIELWKSDGTEAGTMLVKDISSGDIGGLNASNTGQLTNVNSTLFFVADDGIHGAELWKSDGTEAGTVLVKDIYPDSFLGTNSSNPAHLTNVNGTLYFSAYTGEAGEELWKSDGTAAGTVMVRDLDENWTSSSPRALVPFGSQLYFTAYVNGIRGFWQTDGTAGGTHFVKDIGDHHSIFSEQRQTVIVNGTMYFITQMTQLWRSDGTPAGTTLIKDFATLTQYATPRNLTSFNGKLVLSAAQGTGPHSLWVSDGTEAGTVPIAQLSQGLVDGPSSSLTTVGSQLFFAADDGVHGHELWKTDGSAAGTQLVKNIRQNVLPQELVHVAGSVYFTVDAASGASELWVSDGSAAGTTKVFEVSSGPFGSSVRPRELTAVGSTLFFVNDLDGELWKSGGTPETTVRVKDIRPGFQWSGITELTEVGGVLYFAASDGTSGVDLWKSDGTEAGTLRVKDLPNDEDRAPAHRPERLTSVGDVLYFTAGAYGDNELWRSDGTEAGTYEVKNIEGFPGGSPQDLVNVGGQLYFTAFTYAKGRELWTSNGTAAGTRLVADLRPQEASSMGWFVASGSGDLVSHQGLVYFLADDGTHGQELWRSNGAAAGTVLVKDIRLGAMGSRPRNLVSTDAGLFFIADDGAGGQELWHSDGTTGGTHLVKEFGPGWQDGNAIHLTAALGGLLFTADSGIGGSEVWFSDGTSAGTHMLVDVAPGPASGGPSSIVAVGDRAFFVASTDDTGVGVWSVGIESGEPPQGDYDANGSVDGRDFLTWQRALGSPNATVDRDGSGQVDAGDLRVWKLNFGHTPHTTALELAATIEASRQAVLDELFAAGDFTQLFAVDDETDKSPWHPRRR